MKTIVYREGLNQKSFELEAKKIDGEIVLKRTDYINSFPKISTFTEHPPFETKSEANIWIKNYSDESYKRDKEFCISYMS